MPQKSLTQAKINRLRDQVLHALQNRRPQQARKILMTLWDGGVRNIEVMLLLGGANGELGNYAEAEKYTRSALQLEPRNAWAHNNLGNVLREQGKLQEAVAAYGAAIKLDPKFAEAYANLGVALMQARQHAQALGAFQQTLRLNPEFIPAYTGLSSSLLFLGQFEEALKVAQAALNVSPQNVDLMLALAEALEFNDRPQEGMRFYQRALAAQPRNNKALSALALMHSNQGDMQAAREHLHRLRKAFPQDANGTVIEASLLEKAGDYSAAWNLLEPLLDPRASPPLSFYRALGNVTQNLSDADVIQRVTDRLTQVLDDAQDLPVPIRLNLHFYLGALNDKLGAYEQAFRHFDAGNRLKPIASGLAPEADMVEQFLQFWTPEQYAAIPQSGLDSQTPVFIIGMPRSGSTLIEQILDSHPSVHGAGELLKLVQLTDGCSERTKSGQGYPQCLQGISEPSMLAMANDYLEHITSLDADASRITDKLPHNFIRVGLIAKLFPQAKIIHARRNPIDTCLSCYFQHFNTGHYYAFDLQRLGEHYVGYRRIMRHWTETLGIAMFELDYDQMVNEQEAITRKLLQYLGLEWDPACLDFQHNLRYAKTASYRQVRKPIYRSSLRRRDHYRPYVGPLIDALGKFAEED